MMYRTVLCLLSLVALLGLACEADALCHPVPDAIGSWNFRDPSVAGTPGNGIVGGPSSLAERAAGGNPAVYTTDTIAGTTAYVADWDGTWINGQRGYSIDHGTAGNSGTTVPTAANKLNAYTLAMDVYYDPQAPDYVYRTLLDTNSGAGDGEWFIRRDTSASEPIPSRYNGLGGNGQYGDTDTDPARGMLTGVWGRVLMTYDNSHIDRRTIGSPTETMYWGPAQVSYVNGAWAMESVDHDYSGTSTGTYIDGQVALEPGNANAPPNDGPSILTDRQAGGNENLPGKVNSVALWDRVLSPAEIAALGSPDADGIVEDTLIWGGGTGDWTDPNWTGHPDIVNPDELVNAVIDSGKVTVSSNQWAREVRVCGTGKLKVDAGVTLTASPGYPVTIGPNASFITDPALGSFGVIAAQDADINLAGNLIVDATPAAAGTAYKLTQSITIMTTDGGGSVSGSFSSTAGDGQWTPTTTGANAAKVTYNAQNVVVDLMYSKAGDVDGDGDIDGGDRNIQRVNYDPFGSDLHYTDGDLNGDGDIDGGDRNTQRVNYDPFGYSALPLGPEPDDEAAGPSAGTAELWVYPSGAVSIAGDGVSTTQYNVRSLTDEALVAGGTAAPYDTYLLEHVKGIDAETNIGNTVDYAGGGQERALNWTMDMTKFTVSGTTFEYFLENDVTTYSGNVVLIPEPGMVALLAMGLVAVGLGRVRRRFVRDRETVGGCAAARDSR